MCRGAGKHLLLHHLHERELRAPRDAGGRRSRASCAACICCKAAAEAAKARACSCSARARSCARCSRRPRLLEEEFGVPADVWSVTSFSELRREALDVERWNTLHPEAEPRVSYVARLLAGRQGPFVAATDYMKIVVGPDPPVGAGPLRRARHRRLRPQRRARRRCASTSRSIASSIVVAALKALADDGGIDCEDRRRRDRRSSASIPRSRRPSRCKHGLATIGCPWKSSYRNSATLPT